MPDSRANQELTHAPPEHSIPTCLQFRIELFDSAAPK